MLALADRGGVGNLVNLEPVHAALVGEDQQIGVRGGDDQVLHHVFGARGHADAPLAAAGLTPVGIDGGALQIAAARHGDGDVLHLHQIFQLDLAGIFDDLGAPLVAEILLDFLQLFDDHAAQNSFPSPESPGIPSIRTWISASSSRIFCCSMPVRRWSCSSMIACACFSLNSKLRDQALARFLGVLGGADQLDHRVQIVERLLEPEQKMLALASLAQQVIGAAADHVDAMLDEALQRVEQAHLARLPVDDGQQDHAEADLHLRLLVQVVEHHLGLLAALQLDHDAHSRRGRSHRECRRCLRASSRSPARRCAPPGGPCSPGTESR